jgi:hypothetical protein
MPSWHPKEKYIMIACHPCHNTTKRKEKKRKEERSKKEK